jgi:hypothetical protein
MPQFTIIEGPDGTSADVVQANGHKGLVTSTIPGLQYTPKSKLFTDPNGNINLNVDASSSGTPDGIHNGTDSVLWTAVAASGTWDFASTAQAQQGTKSIDATATVNGDQALITRSSAIDVDNYNSVSGFIYITQFNASGNGIIVSLQIAGAPNGLPMDLADFVNTSDLNVWQKFTVPISTFEAAGNVDEFSVVTVRTSGQPPNYYLDTIQLEEAGSIVYTAEPERGFRYEFNALDILVVDALDTTLLNNSMPNLSYDKILGVPQLANGVTLRFTQAGRVQFSGTFRDLGGLLFAAFVPSAQGCDGTNTFLKLTADLSEFARMEPSRGDKIELIVSDDLSGLLQFRANIRGRELVT